MCLQFSCNDLLVRNSQVNAPFLTYDLLLQHGVHLNYQDLADNHRIVAIFLIHKSVVFFFPKL